jgi:hypothetical protein
MRSQKEIRLDILSAGKATRLVDRTIETADQSGEGKTAHPWFD